MIDPAVILTLLEPGPRLCEELALDLSASHDLVKHELTRLVRSGVLKRTGAGSLKNYALASYVPKPGRPMLPGRSRRGARQVLLCATCHRKQAKHAGYCRTCARAAGLWTKNSFELDRERMQRRAERQAVAAPQQFAVPPVRQTRSCVVEGVEYQIVDYDALLERDAKHWPSSGSSLAAPFFDRPRLKNETRRGAHS